MKALTHKFRILHTLGLLLLAVTIGHGQGYNTQGMMATYNTNADKYLIGMSLPEFTSERDHEGYINYHVQNSNEKELIVENWMEVSFLESVESELEIEEWMTQPIHASLENELIVEDWMTVSFTESTEEELSVEDWMTEALLIN